MAIWGGYGNNVYDLPKQTCTGQCNSTVGILREVWTMFRLNDGDTVTLANTPYVTTQHAGTHLELKSKEPPRSTWPLSDWAWLQGSSVY